MSYFFNLETMPVQMGDGGEKTSGVLCVRRQKIIIKLAPGAGSTGVFAIPPGQPAPVLFTTPP